jgi:hypothetical protein
VTARAGALLIAAVLTLAACSEEDRADQEAFCTELRQSIDQNVTVFDPQDPADPEEARATLDELAALAPDEISADVVVLRDAFAELAGAIADLDLEDPSAADTLADIELDEERIARAQAAMAAYGRDTCRIPLLNGPPSVTTAPTTTTVPPSTTTPRPADPGESPSSTTTG